MTITRRHMIAALAAALPGLSVQAQPGAKVVRFILPNAVGSGVDALARAAQLALSTALGASVVIENQPGAGGLVGLQNLARSAPDGQTLSIVSNNVVIFPSVLKSIPFKMPGDFTPIAIIGYAPMVLVVNPNNVSAKNSKEFIALLKSKPGKFNYGSGGAGTILHLTSAMFLDEAGATANHVPYKGVGPMVTDLVGGQIDFATAALASVQAQITAGKLRAIGVSTPNRIASAPDIPTFAEQGLPGFVVEAWIAALGPAGMSGDEVGKVHRAIVSAFDDAAVKQAMAAQGNIIQVSTPQDAAKVFQRDLVKYAQLVKKAGVEPN